MTIEFNGIEELMWCSAKIKKEDLLNKDQNFLISTVKKSFKKLNYLC